MYRIFFLLVSPRKKFGTVFSAHLRWQLDTPNNPYMTYMTYIPSQYLRAKTNFFSKFFKIRLAIVQKAVYIRKSSVILELNASVDLMRLIKNFEKSFKVDLKNCLKCDIL